MCKKAFIISLLFHIFYLNICWAQDSLKTKLNHYIDSKYKKVEPKIDSSLIIPLQVKIPEKAPEKAKLQPLEEVTFQDFYDPSTWMHPDPPIKQEEEKDLRGIDTVDFRNRTLSVKKRDMDLYGNSNYSFTISNNNPHKKQYTRDPSKKVIGWHPFWMKDAYESYNYSLLSAVIYFSYDLNPGNGEYKSIHDWETTPLIDSAHKAGCKVLLSVSNFGINNNALFLSNPSAQRKLIENLIELLQARNADGVSIDFEMIPSNKKEAFTNFIIDLSSSLKSVRKDYWITLAVPALDAEKVYDIAQLNKHIDLYLLMGYEFYGANSKMAGPLAPIGSGDVWWPYNIERAVDEYVVAGVNPAKLILGLPYYGAEWQTADLKYPSKAKRFIQYPMYRDIKNNHENTVCCEEEASMSKFFVYRDNTNNYRQIWYDDSLSLTKKYDWINNKKLGGVAIWALGYDNGHNELWKVLGEKFKIKEDNLVKKASKKPTLGFFNRIFNNLLRFIRNPASLLSNPRALISIFGAIFGVSVLGFFILYSYGCRFKRLINVILKGGISMLVILLIALIFVVLRFTGFKEISFLLIGFIVGAIIFLILSRQFLSEKDLP